MLASELEQIRTYRQEAATNAGLDTEKIKTVYLELSHLREHGILVHLNIHGSSMFSTAATWLELGVVDEKIQERFTRGRKQFFRDAVRELKSVESRLRQTLTAHAYDIAGFRPFRWMPWTAYRSFREEFQRLQEEMEFIKDRILIDYDTEVERTREDFEQISAISWRAIIGQGAPGAFIDGELCTSEEIFTRIIVDRAIGKIPSVDQIQEGLTVDYSTAMVYGESDKAFDTLAAEKISGELELERARISAERERIYLENRSTEQTLNQQEALDLLERQRRQVEIDAMRTAEIEHARAKLQEMGSPFVDVISQLRTRIANDAVSMLESIQKNGFVRGKVAEKGRGLLEFYNLMAAHDDDQLRATLEKLSNEIGPDGTEARSVEDISSTLATIADLALADAGDLRKISRAAFVEV